MTDAPRILIVGAGPTGLVLALMLARQGVPFRLIDRNSGPGQQSRAMNIHARVMELYDQLGIAEDMIAAGIKVQRVTVRRASEDGGIEGIARFDLGDFGRGMSPFPFMLSLPQDQHEALLVDKLNEAGGRVEWLTMLVGASQDEAGITARIEGPDGPEDARFDWVCGCDGAHSQLRRSMGIAFEGGTYAQPFYVADVRLSDPPGDAVTMTLGERLLALIVPVRRGGVQRLIGLLPPDLIDKPDISFADIQPRFEALTGFRVASVNWFSAYRVHHRVADQFRKGRAFLLGDAGHVHSPVGGQGMNTGIGDAINLGWKLGAVMRGAAAPAILDSYEPERIAFARTLVRSTDNAFRPLIMAGWKGALARRWVMPAIVRLGLGSTRGRRAMFRLVSQIRIAYPHSPLSRGRAGGIRAGQRLPWTGADGPDNFAPLKGMGWQIHVHGAASPAMAAAAAERNLPLHAWPWGPAAEKAGYARDAAHLVRPDGHVGWIGPANDSAGLLAYLAHLGWRPA